ncbi:MAG: PEP/pyruvate-binding domain-containing protein, partial [Bacteroidota bacterium]
MRAMYRPVDLHVLSKDVRAISSRYDIRHQLEDYIEAHADYAGDPTRITATAEIILAIRQALPEVGSRSSRLALLDISNDLEDLYFKEVAQWTPKNTAGVMDKICYTAMATAGAGLIEKWEWEAVKGQLAVPLVNEMSLGDLNNYLATARGIVEWGTGTVNGVYGDVIDLFDGFEPMAHDFSDDIIRSSVLLRLGQSVSEFGNIIAKEAGLSNQLFSLSETSAARGLNPGYAMGELVIMDGYEESPVVDNSKIYLFRRPPSSLKPVAGIATVTEGNMVSHVQLLARNLGIPNAVISNEILANLKKYAGKEVFYAVSNEGTVIMKLAKAMTATERDLFAKQERSADKITVPTVKIDLAQTRVLNMREVDATASGVVCGPKAANLGQLKALFPDNVVEGLVIPFGIFRQHMSQPMPGQEGSYWEFLQATFDRAEGMQAEGQTSGQREAYILRRLSTLQNSIKRIALSGSFLADLRRQFENAFGSAMGKTPVFLRSDTNMEDLPEFTGAGLNLTKFNVVSNQDIIEGIKEVWASPYTERSFKWRQRYLLNPENVFPSILIIPTVDVDHSGVMITKGITTQDGRDVTVAFSRGAGGAVDGQAAETYLLRHTQENILLSPAREPNYRRLPQSGGSIMRKATFNQPILSNDELYQLRKLAYEVHYQFPKNPYSKQHGPFDIELGFQDGYPWLFQVRPFVENKRAKSSTYLKSIAPDIPTNKMVQIRRDKDFLASSN